MQHFPFPACEERESYNRPQKGNVPMGIDYWAFILDHMESKKPIFEKKLFFEQATCSISISQHAEKREPLRTSESEVLPLPLAIFGLLVKERAGSNQMNERRSVEERMWLAR